MLVVRQFNAGIKANEGSRNTIQYRPLTRLDKMKFRDDLRTTPWSMIESFDDPTDPLALCYAMLDSIPDRHTPFLLKRFKSLQLPPSIATDILSTIRERDLL